MFSNRLPLPQVFLFLILILAARMAALAQTFETDSSFLCDDCDYTVTGYMTDGKKLNIQPGDVICLDARRKYTRIVLKNIVGTEDDPVIIRNCGGVAEIYSRDGFGMKFQQSKHFKLAGDGSVDSFGIKITTEKGFYLTMENFTTDFEISRVEIAGATENGLGEKSGFAGIGIKTSPYQDCELFSDSTKQAWTMQNIAIHHNYIHDTGGEGLYIGHGFYMGRKEKRCPNVTYPHTIQQVRIYENLIENVGYDGIQIKDANKDVAVYNNVIRNYGTKGKNAHNEGLFIGEGTTGKFYGNIVDTGTGNGCQIQGIGNIDIFNNFFFNSGENGIYAASGHHAYRYPDGYFNITDNIIYNSRDLGFVFYNDKGGIKKFENNMVIKAGTLTKDGAKVVMNDNIFTNESDQDDIIRQLLLQAYARTSARIGIETVPVE